MVTAVAACGRIAVLSACFAVGVFHSEASVGASPSSIWETNVAAACLRAQSEQKPLVVYFFTSDGEGGADACRQFEAGPLASPALAGFREWAVLVKIDPSTAGSDRTARELLQVVALAETPAVAVVAQHRDGWATYGTSVGYFEPADFIRLLRGDVVHAMIGVCRNRQRAMPNAERARKQEELFRTCGVLRTEGDQVAKAYDEQLARLRDEGRFRVGAFNAATRKRQELLQKWTAAFAEFAALPEYEIDPLCEVFLNGFLLSHDVSQRLAMDLAGLATNDRLPTPRVVAQAQDIVRAAEKELEAMSRQMQETVAGAGKTRHGRSTSKPESSELRPRRTSGRGDGRKGETGFSDCRRWRTNCRRRWSAAGSSGGGLGVSVITLRSLALQNPRPLLAG